MGTRRVAGHALKLARVRALSDDDKNGKWFQEWKTIIDDFPELTTEPGRVVNMDEFGMDLSSEHNEKGVWVSTLPDGSPRTSRFRTVGETSSTHTTMISFIGADGSAAPNVYLFTGEAGQASWFAGDPPPPLTKRDRDAIYLIPTESGKP